MSDEKQASDGSNDATAATVVPSQQQSQQSQQQQQQQFANQTRRSRRVKRCKGDLEIVVSSFLTIKDIKCKVCLRDNIFNCANFFTFFFN